MLCGFEGKPKGICGGPTLAKTPNCSFLTTCAVSTDRGWASWQLLRSWGLWPIWRRRMVFGRSSYTPSWAWFKGKLKENGEDLEKTL